MEKKKTLVLGASDNPARYSYLAIQRLRRHEHPVVAIGRKNTQVADVPIGNEQKPFENIDTVTFYLNPAHQKEYYDYMMSWSPYDNVKKASYPAIFATGGLNDTQVPYFSPAKWVAKVRENNTGTNPVLFRCNMGAGHGGE